MTARVAIILAAGRGSRLAAHTQRLPKCLVRLGGRTLLAWQRAALQCADIGTAVVVSGYRGEAIARAGAACVPNPEWASSGPVASLLCARPEQYGDFLVVYGDCVFHPQWLRALAAPAADIAFASDTRWHDLWSLRFADVLADAEGLRHDGGRLSHIGGRAARAADIQGQFAGLLRFSARGWRVVQQTLAKLPAATQRTLDMTGLLARLVEDGHAVEAVPIEGRWCEVDSAADLALYRRLLRRRAWSHDWRWDAAAWA